MIGRSAILKAAFVSMLVGSSIGAFSQKPDDQTLTFFTEIGSFKMIDGSGRVEIKFKGTLLVNNLKGTVTPSGNLKLEYNANNRKGYYGEGKVVIDGSFRSVQWFGQKMHGTWKGRGLIRLYGEFDKNQKTGTYFYSHKPTYKIPWPTYGNDLHLPEAAGHNPLPTDRRRGG